MKVKFLTVIWGTRYIDEFAALSLPSYLAPGNLPDVARQTDLEVLIMTSAEGRAHFADIPIMEKVRALCPVRFILIDDLITTGVYGVTLTLAYARGIIDSGQQQTSTHFIFMNSDFVLADGSLRSTIAKLREGYPCVMAPSLRASAEAVLPTLANALSKDGHCLNMPPRAMVQLTFDNLHPTVLAKTVTQQFVSCETHNQIYWQVDETTLLARYHLIFMLAIKPEVPMKPVNSYCDYGFVPELVPSGRIGFMDDSDDFFMLELQPHEQEKSLLRCGVKTQARIAAELSRWATNEHRRCAEVDLVFRCGAGGEKLAGTRSVANQFMMDLRALMAPEAVSHVGHEYWVSGLQAWGALKFTNPEKREWPPEIMNPDTIEADLSRKPAFIGFYQKLLRLMRRYAGQLPDVRLWNHLWLDSCLLRDWLAGVTAASPARVLLIYSGNSPLARELPRRLPVDVQSIAENLDESIASKTYDRILIHIYRAHIRQLRNWLDVADRQLSRNGQIAIFIEHPTSELEGNFSSELSQYTQYLLPAKWIGYRLEGRFVGGRLKRKLRLAERFLYRQMVAQRIPVVLVAVGSWGVWAVAMMIYNLLMRNASSDCPNYCSSAMLTLSRTGKAATTEDESIPAKSSHVIGGKACG
ncbi:MULTISPECIES: hypothetical protein [unclassified Bradyrhizobium]|uniref:hypothetical protein n=1 Tax=unclassified Bradyrhizobium TaxID=2631580 RepID=UPI00291664E0|nr:MULTISPECIES: hypothetical protein [unclassified Bradyrhizobium]